MAKATVPKNAPHWDHADEESLHIANRMLDAVKEVGPLWHTLDLSDQLTMLAYVAADAALEWTNEVDNCR